MSPDWSAKSEPVPYAVMGDPQSLNLYGYGGNNPLRFVDSDGHSHQQCDTSTTSDSNGNVKTTVNCTVVSDWYEFFWLKSALRNAASGTSLAVARWGRLGGPAHRAAVNALARQWEKEGYAVDREHMVRTPNGAKNYRFVDVHGEKTNPDGTKSERWGQIGRTNADGETPVAREETALNDIEASPNPGVRPEFYDYQAPLLEEGGGGLPGWPVQPAPMGMMGVPGAGGAAEEEEPVVEP
jgi:hypothetical protein